MRLDDHEVKFKKTKIDIKCDICGVEFKREYRIYLLLNEKNKRDLCKGCALRNSEFVGKKKDMSVTLDCEYCGKSYTASFARRSSKFCSKDCQISGGLRNSTRLFDAKNVSTCLECKTEFTHYGSHKYCSVKCNANASARLRIGEGNPNFKIEKEKFKCVVCNKIFESDRYGLHKGQVRKICSNSCRQGFDVRTIDSDDQLYRKTKSYNRGFRKTRKLILERDNHECILCGSKDKLEVHHIDDDEKNDDEKNLMTLCRKCHNITKFNRDFWQRVFIGLGSNSKVVKKGWGLEIHFVNNDKYCLKYLIFFKGRKFSLHVHAVKQELWFCSWGSFNCTIIDDSGLSIFKFSAGDKIELKPGIIHMIEATTNSIITEVSTTDYPEDSIRFLKGD
jgi:mannose-6-phosphate isomerase-like protein (cupin superfamily)